jgi:ribosomal protein L3 glutamine methyltransferase
LTLGQLIDTTARRLARARLHYGHGTGNPRDEAAWLVLRGLGLAFATDLQERASPGAARKVERLARRRIEERIPLAYLLGEAWLDGLAFHVDRRVIIPRSHIPFVLKTLALRPRRILDLCTGSGCLAILAARAYPRAQVDAVDISAAALAVARKNVARYRLEGRVRLVRSDLFRALAAERYDLVVSNPPYVPAAAMRALPPEYRCEPAVALAGGADGLGLVSRLLAEAPAHMKAGARLVCEVGDGREAVRRAWPRLPLAWPKEEVFVLKKLG